MSFLIKHQIMHVIRQRQQKRISEENSVYFDILQRALPQEPTTTTEENKDIKNGLDDGTSATVTSSTNVQSDHRDSKPRVSPKNNHGGGGTLGGGKNHHRDRIGSSSGRHNRSSGTRLQDNKSTSGKSQHTQSINDNHNQISGHGPATVATANGDLPRPSSAGKVHVVGGKKQLAVKAVPRSNQLPQGATPVAIVTTPTSNVQDTVKDKVCVCECVCERACIFSLL